MPLQTKEPSSTFTQSSDTASKYLVFPRYLTDEYYQYRHIQIKVKRSDASLDDALKMAEAAFDTGKNFVTTVGARMQGTVDNTGDGLNGIEQQIEAGNEFKKEIDKHAKTVQQFFLPLPNEFTETTSHDWNSEKGLFGTAYETIGNIGVGGVNLDKAMGMAADAAGMRKPIGNPGYWQSYTGTQPREFTFSFDFIPDSIEDAVTIMDMVKLFKIYTLPQSTMAGAMVLAPHYFEISLANPFINDMIRLEEVVCTNMTVNYGADGQMQQTQDGFPKFMSMSLSFREKRMQYATPTGGM